MQIVPYVKINNINILQWERKIKIFDLMNQKDDLMKIIEHRNKTIDELKKENIELKFIKLEYKIRR